MKNTIIALLLFTVTFFGCKEKEEPTPDPKKASGTIVMLTNTALPGQFVYAQTNVSLEVTESSFVLVNGTKAQLYSADSNKIFFILPAVIAGNTNLNYSSIGVTNEVNLVVSEYTPISDPEAVLNEYTLKLEDCAKKLESYSESQIIDLDENNLALLRYINTGIKKQFDLLSPADKITAAYILKSNILDETKVSADSLYNPFFARLATTNRLDPEEGLKKHIGEFLFNGSTAVAACGLGFALLNTPSPDPLTKIASLASTSLGVYQASLAIRDIKLIAKAKGLCFEIGDANVIGRVSANDLNLENNKSTKVSFKGQFSNPISSDSTKNYLNNVFTLEKTFRTSYNRMINAYNTIAGWGLGLLPTKPLYEYPFQSQKSILNFPLAGSKITISNISDPSIRLNATSNDTSLNITASCATCTTDKVFTFEASYQSSITQVTLKRSISASLKAAPTPPQFNVIFNNFDAVGVVLETTRSFPSPILNAYLTFENRSYNYNDSTFDMRISSSNYSNGFIEFLNIPRPKDYGTYSGQVVCNASFNFRNFNLFVPQSCFPNTAEFSVNHINDTITECWFRYCIEGSPDYYRITSTGTTYLRRP